MTHVNNGTKSAALCVLGLTPLLSGLWIDPGGAQRSVTNRFEFRARFPFGHARIIGNTIADQEIKLAVLHGPAQVPIWFDRVRRLVVILCRVLPSSLQAPSRGLADKIDSFVGIESRDTS